MGAYYNEHDPPTAAWLRELIKKGLIADGEVDERSIADVTADDVRGFVQCHFFAGIGGWSLALRLAGWPDDRHVWTGSCPCQPFSAAGTGDGEDDPRDLWPTWFELWRECRPDVVFGEQVAAAARAGWLDRLSADVEGIGYAVGAVVLGAHSVGAFHIRQRLWFVADCDPSGQRLKRRTQLHVNGHTPQRHDLDGRGSDGDVADAASEQRRSGAGHPETGEGGQRAESSDRRVPIAWGDPRCGCWDRDAFHRTVGMLPGEVCSNAGRHVADAEGRGLGIDGPASGHPGHADERKPAGILGESAGARREGQFAARPAGSRPEGATTQRTGAVGVLADTKHAERRPLRVDREDERDGHDSGRPQAHGEPGARREVRELGQPNGGDAAQERQGADELGEQRPSQWRREQQSAGAGAASGDGSGSGAEGTRRTGDGGDTPSARSFWDACDWLPCRDGKARPVEPGTFPLAHGVPARVGRLRGYGNAIVPQVAAAFIESFLDVTE